MISKNSFLCSSCSFISIYISFVASCAVKTPAWNVSCRRYRSNGRCRHVLHSKFVVGTTSEINRLEAKIQRFQDGLALIHFYNIVLSENCKEMIYDVYCHYYYPACDLTTSIILRQPVCKETCFLLFKSCKKELEIGRAINNSPFDVINCTALPRKNAGESPVCYHHPNLNSKYDVNNLYSSKFRLGKARVKRRTSHVPNLMLMSKLYCSTSFALDSAHVKLDV